MTADSLLPRPGLMRRAGRGVLRRVPPLALSFVDRAKSRLRLVFGSSARRARRLEFATHLDGIKGEIFAKLDEQRVESEVFRVMMELLRLENREMRTELETLRLELTRFRAERDGVERQRPEGKSVS